MVSSETIAALKPVSLEGDSHYDKDEITWTTSEGAKTTIKTHEIVLVAEIPGETHLIVTLAEDGQPPVTGGDDGDGQHPPPAPPFTLSSFLAPSRQVPLEELRAHHLVLDDAVPEFLRAGPDASVDVIVSVRSGTGLAQQFYEAVVRPLLGVLGLTAAAASDGGKAEEKREDGSYNVTFTEDADSVKKFARERWSQDAQGNRKEKKKETIILLSGDGGIVDLLSGTTPPPSTPEEQQDTTSSSSVASHLPTIVLLPLGTGNALFHSLHKPHYHNNNSNNISPSHLVLAVRALLQGHPAALPTFQATFQPAAQPVPGPGPDITEMTGAIVASYGFHAQLVWESDTPAYRVHGAKRFGMVAQELLRESHAYRAVVEMSPVEASAAAAAAATTTTGKDNDDKDESNNNNNEHSYNYILTTLCSNLEKTFTISPASEPLDGVLRLVRFGGADGKRTMEIMGAAYQGGKHVGMEGVGYEAVGAEGAVKVTTLEEDARWRKVCVDGTIVEMPPEGSMTVRRSPGPRLRVVVLGA